MKKCLLAVFVSLAALIAFSMTFAPPSDLEVSSVDGQFKVHITPPRFKNETSYFFFQRQDFITLEAFEGEQSTESARIRIALYRKYKKNYVCVWKRTAASTIIPTSARILVCNGDPIVILEGEYAEPDLKEIPYGVYKLSGLCVTNSAYPGTNGDIHKLKWECDGKELKLLSERGSLVTSMPL